MGWFGEDEQETDYLGLLTGLPLTLFALLSGYLCIAYESILGGVICVGDLLALKEWWGTEHTMAAVWFTLCVPAFWKRSSGKCQDVFLQVLSGLTGLMIIGSFIQLATSIQAGPVFGGKFSMPTLALITVVVMMFGSSIEGMKKEIYGYGVSDSPTDEKCALVFDSVKKFIAVETVIFLSIATFGLPSLDIGSEDYNYIPWLSAFPILGLIRAMNTYFAPEAVVAEVAIDVNGLPPQPKEDQEINTDQEKEVEEKEPEKEVEKEGEAETDKKETEEKSNEGVDTEEKVEEKVDTEPKESPPSIICKIITKLKGLVGCIINLVLTVVGKITSLITCVINHVTSLITCVINHVLSLPWNCIVNTAICLGTKVTLTYCFWHLTEDPAVFAFPVIDLAIPYLVVKAKEREWLTDNSGHVISETASLVSGCTLYYVFRTYSSAQPI